MKGGRYYFAILALLLFVIPLASEASCGGLDSLTALAKSHKSETITQIDSIKNYVLNSNEFKTCNDFKLKGDFYYRLGLKYFNLHSNNSYLKAVEEFKVALSIRHDSILLEPYDDEVVKCRINIGRCYLYDNQYALAREVFEECYRLKDRISNVKTKGRLIYHLGDLYDEMGIFDRASNCFDEVIQLTIDGEEALFDYMVLSYNLNSIAKINNGSYVEAEKIFNFYKNNYLSDDGFEYLTFLVNYSTNLYHLHKEDSALVVLKVLESKLKESTYLIEEDKDFYNNHWCWCYLGQVRALTNLNKLKEAKNIIVKADNFCKVEPLDYEDNLADVFFYSNNLDSALYYYHAALLVGFSNDSGLSLLKLPKESISKIKNQELRNLLEVTDSYARTAFLKYKETQKENYLVASFEAYELYDQLFLKNFEQLLTDNSRYRLIEESRPAFEHAMETAYELYKLSNSKDEKYAEKAFHFSERIRANLLFTSISQKDALSQSLIPDHAKTDIENLQVQIRVEDELLSNATNQNIKDSLKRSIDDLNIHLDIAKATLAKNYPAYHNLAFSNHELPSFNELRKKVIEGNKVMVEYFTTDDFIYILGICKKKSYLDRIDKTENFDAGLSLFLKSISDWDYISTEKKVAFNQYLFEGHKLYQSLLSQLLQNLNKRKGDLVIIPDGKLNYIPFATLLDNQAEDLVEASFLVEKYNISYDYSAKSLLRNTEETKSGKVDNICAFAPTYEHTGAWHDLKYNVQEIDLLKNIFGNIRSFRSAKASKNSFEQHCNDCDILHIASHGSLDEDDSKNNHLVFYSDKEDVSQAELNVSRINLLHLKAQLTVLSSCETAMGTQKSNEGLTSVSNAFSYAGSKSVMASLWLLNDKKAYEMMEEFYTHLKNGESKSLALANAQRKMLEESGIHRHPYYWGNLMLSGSTDALFGSSVATGSKNNRYWSGLGILVTLFMGSFFWRRRKKKNRKNTLKTNE